MFHQIFALTIRSFRVAARRPFEHLLRLAICLVLLLQLYSFRGTTLFAAPGLQVFMGLLFANAIFITGLVPTLFAGAITEEKENRTLSLLRVADVGALSLLAGKLFPQLVGMLLVLLSQLPFTMLAITLGGVTFDQIVAGYAALAAYLVATGCLGILCSVPFEKSGNSRGLAGLLMVAYHVSPLVILPLANIYLNSALFGPVARMGKALASAITKTNIFNRLRIVSGTGFTGSAIDIQFISNLVAGALFFLLAWVLFEVFNRETEGARQLTPRNLIASRPRERVWAAALVWKDFKFDAGGMPFALIKTVVYLLAAMLIAVAMEGWTWSNLRGQNIARCMIVLTLIFIPIEMTLAVARLVHSEVQDRTLSTLLLLPYSPRQILYRKFAGELISLVPTIGLLALALLLNGDEVLHQISRARWGTAVVLTIVAAFVQLLLAWHLILAFSIRMNPGWAFCLSMLLQYLTFLAMIVVVQSLTFQPGRPPMFNQLICVYTAVSLIVMGFLHAYIPGWVARRAAED